MKYRRLLISFILVVVLPGSNYASVIAGSHCQTTDNSPHSIHSQMDEDQHQHMQDHISSETADNHSDCECGCDGNVNCSVSGCSAAALLNVDGIETSHLTQMLYQGIAALVDPPDPHLLLRPPISLS